MSAIAHDLFTLAGKNALVTGGARGIGYICAEALIDHGASVIITSRSEAEGEAACAQLGRRGPCQLLTADLLDLEGVAALCELLSARLDALDVLVNNAGATWGAPLEQYPPSAWSKVLRLNVAAPFQLVQGTLRLLEAAATRDSPARVVNIGSVDGHAVGPFDNYAYHASKAALHHLTRVLACRLGPRGITVNCIAPGPIRTKMMAPTLDVAEAEILSRTPLQRLAGPDDIAGALIFLAARAGAFITGSVIPVDGGQTISTWGGDVDSAMSLNVEPGG